MSATQLAGHVVIITGGAAGIGGATTRVMAARGAKVVAVDINEEAGATLLEELGPDAAFINGDVSDPAVAQRAVTTAVDHYGKLTGLVNNAHASRQKLLLDLEQEDWDLSFNTGFNATLNFMKAAYPELVKTKGSIVNFGSGAAMSGQITQAAYAAAKEAIRGLSRVAANEWAKDGIRVNVVSPLALTEGVQTWSAAAPEQYEQVLRATPLGRFGDPATDIAPIVAFLLSEDSQYMTGQTLMADGGTQKLY